MIWQLVREQMRAGRRYVLWTAALLALAVGIASIGALTLTTQRALDAQTHSVLLFDRDSGVWVASLVPEGQQLADDEVFDEYISLTELDERIDLAQAGGSDVVASRVLDLDVVGVESFFGFTVAVTGDFPWELVLVEGTAPQSGEIAIAASMAQPLGVAVGDVVEVRRFIWDDPSAMKSPQNVPTEALTVSGITGSPNYQGRYVAPIPSAFVAWDDTESLSLLSWGLEPTQVDTAPGDGVYDATSVSTELWWDVGDPAISTVGEPLDSEWRRVHRNLRSLNPLAVVSAVLILGLVSMSFAVGRTQAQARMSWVATARTLGATRRTIATATIVETATVGALAGLAGMLLGRLVVEVDVRWVHSQDPELFGPSFVSHPWWVTASAVGLGLVVAAIIGAVPAFWAARVEPVAALKPVNDVSEAEVSRRVSIVWIVAAWAVVVAGTWLMARSSIAQSLLDILMIFAWVAILVLSYVLLQELFRWMVPALGRRCARSARPWVLTAGEELVARPRQGAIPGLIYCIAFAAIIAVVTSAALDGWAFGHFYEVENYGWFAFGGGDPLGVTPGELWLSTAVLMAVVLITLAIMASGARAHRAEDTTRAAIGLSPWDARRASAAQFALPLAIAVPVGLVIGVVAATITYPSDKWLDVDGGAHATDVAWALTSLPVVAPVLGTLVVLALGCVALGTLAATAIKPERVRV